eukprot:1157833-Pelagomonas_calceolata.AAC.3
MFCSVQHEAWVLGQMEGGDWGFSEKVSHPSPPEEHSPVPWTEKAACEGQQSPSCTTSTARSIALFRK